MRKFLLAIAAVTALLGTSAFAADMAVKAPPPPTPAPAYSWTGFYAGGNAGYGWKDPTATFTPDTFTVRLVTCHNFFCPPPASFNIQGALGGLQIGYNRQINQNWLVGFETDFNWSDVKGTGTSNFVFGDPTTSSNFQAFENIKWFGTVRARLGYLPTNNLLLYGTGGLAYGRIDENVSLNSTRSGFTDGSTSFVCTDPAVPNAPGAANCFVGDLSRTMTGFTVGGGAEYRLWQNLSLKAEYLYVNLGHGNTFKVVPQVVYPGTAPATFTAAYGTVDFNVVRAGLNWKFL